MIDRNILVKLLLLNALLTGCRTPESARSRVDVGRHSIDRDSMVQSRESGGSSENFSRREQSFSTNEESVRKKSPIITVSAESEEEPVASPNAIIENSLELPSPEQDGNSNASPLALDQVVQSIYASYPLLQVAFYGRNIASGDRVSAEGAWDLKLKADANNAPIGYYKTYRNGTGFEQPLYNGGEVFGLYKIGQGNFEPWYGNRETNTGGEFSTGIRIPLAQNRTIDERRAALWKANYGVSAVEPFIQAQIIEFIRAGTYAYWDWVAAGMNLRVARELLDLAEERDDQIEGPVKAGARPESLLVDNRRLIVSRQIKLIDAQRKLETTAIKLSLFLRTSDGRPIVPIEQHLPIAFPHATAITTDTVPSEVAEALGRRPELMELNFQYRMAQVDLQQSQNLILPELDATLWSAKDVGGESTPSGNKTPYQAEAGLNFSVPLQRRKARGKVTAVEGKLAQIANKRRFVEDKIATEVQNAVITIDAAYRSIDKAQESVRLNEQMQKFEIVKLEKGDSDLLLVNLREAATFDARVIEIEATQRYFESQADYRAALAVDVTEIPLQPDP